MTLSVFLPPLRARFRALEIEREREWSPEALALGVNQRATLVREHATAGATLQRGDVLPPAVLTDIQGGARSLDSLVASGVAVLVVFRFGECPACNIALSHYRDTLWPVLKAAGVTLAALSSQPVAALRAFRDRQELEFPILSDEGMTLLRTLGLTYTYDEPSRKAALARGDDSATLNGLPDTWELPKPAVIIFGPGRVVQFVDISPDWLNRTETEQVLNVLALDNSVVENYAKQGEI